MNKIFITFVSLMIISCGTNSSEKNLVDANIQLEKDLEMYQNVWNTFLIDGDNLI